MKICLMDMDDRTKQSMSLVFRHRTNDAIVLADEDAADIGVLDLDRENSLESYQSIRGRRPAFRAIGLSSRPDMEYGDVVVLHKPISANRLLEAIQKVSGRELYTPSTKVASAASSLGARMGTSRRKAEASAASAQDKTSFDPNTYLLGAILNAAREAERRDAVAVISFFGDRVIVADNKNRMIQTNLSSSQARAFSLSAIDTDEQAGLSATVGLQRPAVEYLARGEALTRFAGKTYGVPRETFMWKLGAMTSRGRLPAGMDTEQRVYLRRWPNFTRFSYSDNDMRIVAYWVRQASSLREVAEALDIPEQEVFSVYAAAFAAGLAGMAHREVDRVWEAPEVAEHKERGLFSSILKRLIQRKPAVDEEQGVAA